MRVLENIVPKFSGLVVELNLLKGELMRLEFKGHSLVCILLKEKGNF
jgi:hypothetical protein